MFSKIGVPELLIILAIAIVIFGAKTLPKLGKAMGETIGNFKRGLNEKVEVEPEAAAVNENTANTVNTASTANTASNGTQQL